MIALPPSDVPLQCINQAAIEFNIPAKLIISVLEIERGKVGQIVQNKNKTYDIGPMQINSSWLPTLARYGITQHDLQYNVCKNIEVGGWILSKMIANGKDLLSGIGNYHSHTASINKHYGSMVKINYARIMMAMNDGGIS